MDKPRLLVTTLVAALLASVAVSAAAPGSPVVATDHGPIRGVAIGGMQVFRGIPYAAPPVGDLRWRPPQEPARWTGVLDVYDVYLYANTTYTFDFTTTGSADIKFLLFSSVGTTGTFFVPRSERVLETKDHYTVFTAPANAFYGVVLVNDNGVSGTYLLRVVTGIPTTDVGAAPILPARLSHRAAHRQPLRFGPICCAIPI